MEQGLGTDINSSQYSTKYINLYKFDLTVVEIVPQKIVMYIIKVLLIDFYNFFV